MAKIGKLCSGGQTGVDRATLDFALDNNISYGGWVPFGGMAEDMVAAPGLLRYYPHLQESKSFDPSDRTKKNVIQTDATLIIRPQKKVLSRGTNLAIRTARDSSKPFVIACESELQKVINFIDDLPQDELTINISGPRASEWQKGYTATYQFLNKLFES